MLKKRDLQDTHALYELISHPEVLPFVREKPSSYEEYLFMTKRTIEDEEHGKTISRTIIDDWGNPIGTINLYDIENNMGFLGTWIGKPYHGKGYNQRAKDHFFQELFFELNIETIFMRIRVENIRSRKAAEKLPYIAHANKTRPYIYKSINQNPLNIQYDLYEISKDAFTLHYKKSLIHIDMINELEA